MKNKMIAALAGAVLAASAGAASAGTLTNASVSLSNSNVSQPTNVTARYTAATALTTDDNLLIVRFTGLLLVNGACGADITITVNAAPLSTAGLGYCDVFSGAEMQLRLGAGQSVPAGAVVQIVLNQSRATTTAVTGTYSAPTFRTADLAGTTIDAPRDRADLLHRRPSRPPRADPG